MKAMTPSYGQSLIDNAELCHQIRKETANTLHIYNQQSDKVNARHDQRK